MNSSGEALAALAQLRAASRALAEATGVESVLDTLMHRALATAGAQGVLIVAVRPDDRLDVLVTTYGDESRATLDNLPISASTPLADAIRESRPVWLANATEFAERYPELATNAASVAWVALPLRIGARVIGALGIGFQRAQEFGETQRLAMLTLADLCATALDRHVLEARSSEHRLRTLIDSNVIGVIGGDISTISEANDAFLEMVGLTVDDLARGIDFRAITAPESRDADDRAVAGAGLDGRFGPYDKEYVHSAGHRVPARIVGAIISTHGAGRWIALVEDRTEALRRETELRATSARLEALMRNAPVGFAFIDRQLRFQVVNEKLAETNGLPVEDHLGRDVREVVPNLTDISETLFRRAIAGEPVVEADVTGTTPGAPGEQRDWIVSCYPVRDQAGAVLGIGTTVVDVTDRNLLLRAAERLADRSVRLQQFAAALARAVGVDAVVQAIATEGAEVVGAGLTHVAMRAPDDPGVELLQTNQVSSQEQIAWMPVDARSDNENIAALESTRPAYYPSRSDYERRFGGARSEAPAQGVAALAALPLLDSSGRVIASISFAFTTPRDFADDDRGFLETVADIAAQSLDRARLYERERDVARALQMALLPTALPELDDVTTEARYIAGGAGVTVGGDWYDVLRFADGRVGLLIGDAAGRGVEAATLMGKARHAAAALAIERDSPAAVLSRVNEYLHTISGRPTMLTCCYVLLDRDRGILTYASAGHPPPVIVEDGADPCFLYGGRGVPLGVIPVAAYNDAEYHLRGPATIVLYTDGLIERRGETIDAGLDRLLETIRGHGTEMRALCDHLTATLLGDASDDDVALLATRVHSVASPARLDLELPADSRRLHELRTRVTRWLHDCDIAPGTAADVVVALNEAVSNSILHAYVGARARGHVQVAITIDADTIRAVVSDAGSWHARTDRHDGRGLPLMRSLMTEVDIDRSPDGTRIHLVRAADRVP